MNINNITFTADGTEREVLIFLNLFTFVALPRER